MLGAFQSLSSLAVSSYKQYVLFYPLFATTRHLGRSTRNRIMMCQDQFDLQDLDPTDHELETRARDLSPTKHELET